MSTRPGKFLTIEGIEGVGKSTAVKFIENYLLNHNLPFFITREPGGTEIAEQIRKILLTPNQAEKITDETELLLMFACRSQHIEQVIKPNLSAGKNVVSDRFVDASYAYQGGGRQLNQTQIETLDHWVVGDLQPDITILLDAPAEIGLARAKHRGAQDRIEQEKVDFFERVRAVYLARAKKFPKRFRVVDATVELNVVHEKLNEILKELF